MHDYVDLFVFSTALPKETRLTLHSLFLQCVSVRYCCKGLFSLSFTSFLASHAAFAFTPDHQRADWKRHKLLCFPPGW